VTIGLRPPVQDGLQKKKEIIIFGTLNQTAWASARRKQSEFEARYHHLQPKLKHKGPIVGVAHAETERVPGIPSRRK
jgi:hypothetical protein